MSSSSWLKFDSQPRRSMAVLIRNFFWSGQNIVPRIRMRPLAWNVFTCWLWCTIHKDSTRHGTWVQPPSTKSTFRWLFHHMIYFCGEQNQVMSNEDIGMNEHLWRNLLLLSWLVWCMWILPPDYVHEPVSIGFHVGSLSQVASPFADI